MDIIAAVLDANETPRPYAESRPLRLADLTLDPSRAGELIVRIDAAVCAIRTFRS